MVNHGGYPVTNNLEKLLVTGVLRTTWVLTIFIKFASNSKADDNILPLPRPEIDESVKKIISKKKNIYPEKKPDNKKEKKQNELIQESVVSTNAEN